MPRSKFLGPTNETPANRNPRFVRPIFSNREQANFLAKGLIVPYQQTKTLAQSKTFWVNLITAVIGLLMYLSDQPWAKQAGPIIVMVVGVLNVILRYITTMPIAVLLLFLSYTSVADAVCFRPLQRARNAVSAVREAAPVRRAVVNVAANARPLQRTRNAVAAVGGRLLFGTASGRFGTIHRAVPRSQCSAFGCRIR